MRYKIIRVTSLLILLLSWNMATGQTYESNIQLGDSLLAEADFTEARKHYEKALSNTKENQNYEGVTSSILKLADLDYQIGNFKESYQHYTEALQVASKNSLPSKKAQSLQGLAHISWRSGDNIQSINSIIESIALYDSIDDTGGRIKSSNILAGIYLSNGNLSEAENIYNNMLELALELSDSVSMASNYGYKGVVAFFRGNYKHAIHFYEQALEINLAMNDLVEAAINYGNIGEAYGRTGESRTAIENFREALRIQDKYNFLSGKIFIYYSLGEVFMRRADHKNAHKNFQQSLALMDRTGETRERHYVFNLIAQNFALQNNFERAYHFHQLYERTKDSLFNTDKNTQLEQIRAKYDFDNKEQENYFLAKQNKNNAVELARKKEIIRRQYILGGLLVIFLCVSLYLSIKLYRNKILLSNANDAKGKLFGFIAHDLKGPIGNIKSLSDLLRPSEDSQLNGSERMKMWGHLQNSSSKVLVLLNDMLSWSVSQQQGFDFKPENISLVEIVNQNVELFNYQLRTKNIRLEKAIPEDITVYADPDALSTIVRNLVSNAIKFTHENGLVNIYAEKRGETVELAITDNGIGIHKAKIEMLLETKKVMSTSGTANEKGTGLGLNLIKEFIAKSKGELRIESTPNKGTTFYVYLPASNS